MSITINHGAIPNNIATLQKEIERHEKINTKINTRRLNKQQAEHADKVSKEFAHEEVKNEDIHTFERQIQTLVQEEQPSNLPTGSAILSKYSAADVINFQSRYLAMEELPILWDLIENSEEKTKETDEIIKSLTENENYDLEGLLDSVKRFGDQVSIYLALMQILSVLRAKKQKEELQKQLMDIIEQLEQQEQNLFSSFNNLLKLKKNGEDKLNQKNMLAIANFNDNKNFAKITIKSVIKQLKDKFNFKAHNLVSIYMKLHVKTIILSNNSKENNEEYAATIHTSRLVANIFSMCKTIQKIITKST